MTNVAAAPMPADSNPLNAAMAERDRDILQMVRSSLERREAMIAFQPVVNARNPGQVAFFEALIRVMDDTGRIIPAKEFIHACETNEIGRMLDCLALEMGLNTLRQAPDLRLSVNMSARSIGYPRWLDTLNRGLAGDPTVAERLIIEITESSAMVMPDITMVFMKELQLKGVSFALDDFGSGYTAFRYLRDFYFDILKIDGLFCRNIADNPDNQVLAKALVSIAQHFDMFTVAEAVETEADAQVLRTLGLDCMQGYHFGAPTTMPPWEEFPANYRARV